MINAHKNNPAVHNNLLQASSRNYSHNRLKHFLEDLLALVLILITISSLSYAASHLLSDRHAPNMQTNRANTLVPAIYAHDGSADKISL